MSALLSVMIPLGAPVLIPPRSLCRMRYFEGQLLSAPDLVAEQEYYLNRWRRHNQWFHGWGVVGGLELCATSGALLVTPGMALDCRGDEIVITSPARVPVPIAATSPPVLYLVVSAHEELAGRAPLNVVPQTEGASMEWTRIVEVSRLSCVPEDPTQGHKRHCGRWIPCGDAHGIPLGRLRRASGRWRIDSRYRRRHVCACSASGDTPRSAHGPT
jgi:hypothetical protein